ncbi:MAG: DUF1190 domain-containing protein [Phormidesmis sp.]
MTSPQLERQPLQVRSIQMQPIQRDQVRQRLAIAAVVALLVSSCASNSLPSGAEADRPPNADAVTDQNANEEIQAVFYKTTAECEADTQKQQAEYEVLNSAFAAGNLTAEPTPPPIKPEDCEPEMLAAQQSHQQHAPTYASLADCQAEGLECEPSPDAQNTGYYQPRFGGSYFHPFGLVPSFILLNYAGSQRRLYQPSTVYQSSTPGQVVTPNGQVISNRQSGVVTAPRHTAAPAPARPKGTAARGTIRGRGSQGFGSTYKSTGRGGK